ncbi:MAG: nucleotidyltransferase domain-containing protein [Desulfurispora sp.]|uniref:nucleotidyltransferase domain-containing protein n=1 Tax=Desulfurispora sp. TaxID=3014275 RepID=UPI00404B48AD
MAERNIAAIIERYLNILQQNNIEVHKAILFGSYANGTYDLDSDIDLALIGPQFGRDRVEETLQLKKLAEQIDFDLSPRPYAIEQYARAQKGHFLYDEIIRKGIILYEKPVEN